MSNVARMESCPFFEEQVNPPAPGAVLEIAGGKLIVPELTLGQREELEPELVVLGDRDAPVEARFKAALNVVAAALQRNYPKATVELVKLSLTVSDITVALNQALAAAMGTIIAEGADGLEISWQGGSRLVPLLTFEQLKYWWPLVKRAMEEWARDEGDAVTLPLQIFHDAMVRKYPDVTIADLRANFDPSMLKQVWQRFWTANFLKHMPVEGPTQ